MTGPEHYREAEALLVLGADYDSDGAAISAQRCRVEAQVHATLALAAATALVDETPRSDSHSEYRAWAEVAGSDYRVPEPPRVH
ncbi:hypothetical protein [Streptomyces cacaoi]|uniref:hypothetical protein n=1 Tax=Streptomyces cacaoi TaxID=1898 RepID=UPI00260E088B|nr:hypothetical protein [Streptomyces cacaoi]